MKNQSRIDLKFKELKRDKRKALVVYLTAGDPNLTATTKLVRGLEAKGADIIELGIPFSDPLADGPVIQQASMRALRKHTTIKRIMNMVRALRKSVSIPLVYMTYCNPVFKYGYRRFFDDCRRSGIDGVIIPDLPLEESDDFFNYAQKTGVNLIYLVAPTSTPARVKKIARKTQGFVYYVSMTGITGMRGLKHVGIKKHLKLIRKYTDKPICVGFGVSTVKEAKLLGGACDGVIVGSAFISKYAGSFSKNSFQKALKFSSDLAKALHKPGLR